MPPTSCSQDCRATRRGRAVPPVVPQDSIGFSGTAYPDAGSAFSYLQLNNTATMGRMGWTNFCVGHWRGGVDAFYWNIIWLDRYMDTPAGFQYRALMSSATPV